MSEEKNQTPEEVNNEEVNNNEGTEVEETTQETTEETVENPTEPEVEEIPKGFVSSKKFTESQKEALRLIEENKKLQQELEAKKESGVSYDDDLGDVYPGFEDLPEEEQRNLRNYTQGLKKQVIGEIYKDPAIVSAKEQANERAWDAAFQEVQSEIPEVKDVSDFKSKYFNKSNVPTNIKDILTQLAKSELFDKARDLGAKQAQEQAGRIEIERAGGGDKTPTTSRTMEDWQRLAQSNPAKFAQMSKEYNEDLASGKLK